MLEDSITSSPSKSNKSVRETRLLRNKRRKEKSVCITTDHEKSLPPPGFDILHNLYKDSEDKSLIMEGNDLKNSKVLLPKPAGVVRNYEPFERLKTLAVADHIRIPQNEQKLYSFNSEKKEIEKGQSQDSSSNKQNSSFSITESQLIKCCHQAEEMFQSSTFREGHENNIVSQELSPTKQDSLFLVNSILEDFSQSPLKREEMSINMSWEYTPEFRLHRQPVKTYSRRFLNTTKANLSKRFEEQNLADLENDTDDEHESNCSTLSIQEDNMPSEELSDNYNVLTSHTQHLCDNLLNLSEHFTENDQIFENLLGQQDTNPSSDSPILLGSMLDLIKDIIILRSKYPKGKCYNSFNSFEDFCGFSSHSDDGQSTNIDLVNSEEDKINTTLNITYDLNICDNRIADISQDEDNSTFKDWNEDDCQDILAGVNTECILHELLLENSLLKSPKIIEKYEVPKLNSIDCKTSPEKPIKVLKEVPVMSTNVLSIDKPKTTDIQENIEIRNCDNKTINKDGQIFDNPEDYEWNDDCDFFLNLQTQNFCKEKPVILEEQNFPSTSKTSFGFKTAAGKNVHISRKAQSCVEKLLKEFTNKLPTNYNCEKELEELKYKVYAKSHESRKPFNEDKQIGDKGDKLVEKNVGFNIGFRTAGGKNVAISAKAQEKVKNILEEFCLDNEQDFESDLISVKEKLNKKNNELKRIIPAATNDSYITKDILREASENIENNNNCFKDDKNKKIENLKELEKSQVDDNNKDLSNITLSEWPLPNEDETNKCNESPVSNLSAMNNEESKESNLNMGFQTANGKKVFTSTKAQQAVEKLLQEFNTDLYVENYENNLKEMKAEIQIKNKQIRPNGNSKFETNSSQKINQSIKDATQQNISTKPLNCKRKHSIDSNDGGTPPAKIINKGLQKSKSSFAEQTLKSPLIARSAIYRKNLLSLKKSRQYKRKSLAVTNEEIPKISEESYENNDQIASPIRTFTSSTTTAQTPETPNLREFTLNAPLTSTPCLKNPPKATEGIKDTDFKLINWNTTNNDSMTNPTTSNSVLVTGLADCSNTTFNSSNPSAKERIGRLKVYGKAPAVAPIIIETNHSCRPSGLRRTRSTLKKKEE